MVPTFSESGKRLLATAFETGAEGASLALSRWLDQSVRLTVSEVDEIDLAETEGVLGPADRVVAACVMELRGRLSGLLLMVFEDSSGLALTDLLLGRAIGTAESWGEIETSAAMETANIVGCAYLNSLAAQLPTAGAEAIDASLVPSPPAFRHEFAGSLLEFALMDQAVEFDRLLLAKTRFETRGTELDWSLLLVPSGEALSELVSALSNLEPS